MKKLKKRSIVFLCLVLFLSACVYYTLPQKAQNAQKAQKMPLDNALLDSASVGDAELYEKLIESFFNNRPVREVPTNADFASYLKGTFAKEQKDYAILADSFEKVLLKDSENADVKKALYLYFVLSGNVSKALPYAYQAIELDPQNVLPPLVIITEAIQRKDYTLAFEKLDDLQDIYKNFFVPVAKAWIYADLKEEKKAFESLDKLQGNSSFESAYLLNKGSLLEYFNHIEEASLVYDRLMKQEDVKNVRVMLHLREFERRTGALKDKKTFEKFYAEVQEESFISKEILVKPSPVRPKDTTIQGVSWGLFDLSSIFAQATLFDLALYFDNLALFLNPDMPIMTLLKGEVLESLEMREQANSVYQKVPLSSPIYLSSRMRMILNLIKENKLDLAETELKKLIKQYAQIPIFYMTLGDVCRQKNDYKKAIFNYDKTLSLVPTEGIQNAQIYFHKGLCLEALGKHKQALELYEKALSLDKQNPTYMNHVGSVWLRQNKDITKAKQLIEQALIYAPENGDILDSLGVAYFMLNDYDNALLTLEKAVSLKAGDALINSHLGDVYWKKHRYREAKFQWSHAMTLKQSASAELSAELVEKMKKGLD